jgi:hypothetical protein
MNKNGEKLSWVKGFSDILNPAPASKRGYLDASYYHLGECIEQYRFYDTTIKQLKRIVIIYNERASTDSQYRISISGVDGKEKIIYTSPKKAHLFVPPGYRNEVRSLRP